VGIYKPQHSSIIDIGTHYTAMYRRQNERVRRLKICVKEIPAAAEETASFPVIKSGFNHGDALRNSEHNV
jgi:hypothetical protein